MGLMVSTNDQTPLKALLETYPGQIFLDYPLRSSLDALRSLDHFNASVHGSVAHKF